MSASSTRGSAPTDGRSRFAPIGATCSSARTTACCCRPPTRWAGRSRHASSTNRDLWRSVVSSTFHGRDVFAPTAAHLAAGNASFADVGPELPIASLVRLPPVRAQAREGVVETEVTYVDSFGNLRLAGGADELAAAFGSVQATRQIRVLVDGVDIGPAFLVPSFGHVEEGATLLYVDSTGDLALALNQGDLAARIGATTGTSVVFDLP